jgi:hypothetical protein
VTITFNHISLQHVFNIILPSCLSLACLRANICLLGIALVCIKLKGERMKCNIGQDAIFLTHSEMHNIKYMLQRNMVKCNCHKLKYLVLYYERVIVLILRNIVPLAR